AAPADVEHQAHPRARRPRRRRGNVAVQGRGIVILASGQSQGEGEDRGTFHGAGVYRIAKAGVECGPMGSTQTLLESAPEAAARLLALEALDEALAASERLGDDADSEALHDFRVALRRLRSFFRGYRLL